MLKLPITKISAFNACCIRNKSSSSDIRNTFLDYFTSKHDHKFVKSSSVVPLCDPTVPFVNAGMNQFKGVFLGNIKAPYKRVVNSQKCIRVGGKHNDLNVVGTDGTHHTFFEMLGNWSFGDYYKLEACNMAWELLTGPYCLNPDRILVTYFGGDEQLKLNADLECRDIWRSIGIKDTYLRALGVIDNFWEMGVTGPCGPCTELHYINDDNTITELWNIVFIQYNREIDSSISKLSSHHIDTGMGLERLTTLLQGVDNNYNTDLFLPIIRSIYKRSGKVNDYSNSFDPECKLDISYRALADHSRMISICLADGMLPVNNLNLKQIVRKSLKLSHDVFHCNGLLHYLYEQVTEILGDAYPELFQKTNDARHVLEHEEQLYLKMRYELNKKWKGLLKCFPEVEQLDGIELSGLVEGYKQFKKAMANYRSNTVPGDVVFLLYDTHGLDMDTINKIASINNMTIDEENFQRLLENHKSRHKASFIEQIDDRRVNFEKIISKLKKLGIDKTNDSYKYSNSNLKTKLVVILDENGCELKTQNLEKDKDYYILTEETNYFCEEGGQSNDTGKILFCDLVFKVVVVFKLKDYVFHKCRSTQSSMLDLSAVSSVDMVVDIDKRKAIMKNHSAVHLLNATIRSVLSNSVVSQFGSRVTSDGFALGLSIYGEKLKDDVLAKIEDTMRCTIKDGAEVRTLFVSESDIDSDVVRVPGEIYPDTKLRLLEFRTNHLVSKELCCGTHVEDISELDDVFLIRVKNASSHTPYIYGISGCNAKQLRDLLRSINKLESNALEMDQSKLKEMLNDMRCKVDALCSGSGVPTGSYKKALLALASIDKSVQDRDKEALNAMYKMELMDACDESTKLGRDSVVHFLKCSYLSDCTDVVTAIQYVRDRPAMILACSNGIINVSCSVPEKYLNQEFTAVKWLDCVLSIFNAKLASNRSKDLKRLAVMTSTKVSLINCENLVQDAMRAAIAYAKQHTKPSHYEGDRKKMGAQ